MVKWRINVPYVYKRPKFVPGSYPGKQSHGQIRAQNERTVPFYPVLPMELNNSVSGKSDKSVGSVCLQELALMFTCLKEKEFRDKLCSEEIESFNKCYFSQVESRVKLKMQKNSGELTPTTRENPRLNHHQMNALLKKYPQVNLKQPMD